MVYFQRHKYSQQHQVRIHLSEVKLFLLSPLLSCLLSLLQKKVVEQLRKELLVKQEPEATLQLQVQTPPVVGDIKPTNMLQSQQIPGGLQQVSKTDQMPLNTVSKKCNTV